VGPVGPTGSVGTQGSTGPQGIQGSPGPTGPGVSETTYAELYTVPTDALSATLTLQGVFYKIPWANAGISNAAVPSQVSNDITVGRAGIFRLSASITFNRPADIATTGVLAAFKNGVQVVEITNQTSQFQEEADQIVVLTGLLSLSAGDVVDLRLMCPDAAARTFNITWGTFDIATVGAVQGPAGGPTGPTGPAGPEGPGFSLVGLDTIAGVQAGGALRTFIGGVEQESLDGTDRIRMPGSSQIVERAGVATTYAPVYTAALVFFLHPTGFVNYTAVVDGWDGVTGAWGAELSAGFVSSISGPVQVGTPSVVNLRNSDPAANWGATMVATGPSVVVYVSAPTGYVTWAADFKARHRS